jgi:hypothetical protein
MNDIRLQQEISGLKIKGLDYKQNVTRKTDGVNETGKSQIQKIQKLEMFMHR